VLTADAVRRLQGPFVSTHAIGRSVSKPWAMPRMIARRALHSLDRTLG
jgi:hypothetical protein